MVSVVALKWSGIRMTVILPELRGYTVKGEQIKEFYFFRKAEVSRTTCM